MFSHWWIKWGETQNSEPVLYRGAEKLISSMSPFEKPFVFDVVEVANGGKRGSSFAFRVSKVLQTGFLEHWVHCELE